MLETPKNDRLVSCIEFYLQDCLSRRQSPRTVESKRSSLGLFAQWAISEDVTHLKRIDKFVIEGYRQYLNTYQQPYGGKTLDIATIRNRLTAVKVFLTRMRFYELIESDVYVELPTVPRRLPSNYLSVDEVKRIIAMTEVYGVIGQRDRRIIEVFFATGIRRMELSQLNIADVDFQKHLLTVKRGKGNKQRIVPIAAATCKSLIQYIRLVRPLLLQVNSGDILFPNNDGEQLKPQQLSGLITKYVRRAGIQRKGACNLFRHTTATSMHENGADIRHIQSMMGHADISTTQIYTHVTQTKLKEVYERTHPAAKLP